MRSFRKYGILAIVLLCFLNHYGQQATGTENKKSLKNQSVTTADLNMRGAYSLNTMYINFGSGDSLYKQKQFKIYTNKHMMYASADSTDSLAIYGIGNYEVRNGKVYEYVFHTQEENNINDTFELQITKTADGFTQIIEIPGEQPGSKIILTENYKKQTSNLKSPLDGAWRQLKMVYTDKDGKEVTSSQSTVQFKVYESGHFIWANTAMNAETNKPASIFGYGSFKIKDNETIEEVNSNSTFKTLLIGVPVTVKFKTTGKDNYEQTIVHDDGSRTVEYYERLK